MYKKKEDDESKADSDNLESVSVLRDQPTPLP